MTGKLHLATAALLLAVSTGGCGFKPMYAPTPSGADAEASGSVGPVVVDMTPGKAGHELKTALDRRFTLERGRSAPSRLKITLTEGIAGLGYRIDDSATRADLYLFASYQLLDPQGKLRVQGSTQSVASYDIPASAYGDIAAQNAARTRAAEALADQIRLQLAAKIAAAAKKPKPPPVEPPPTP
jgi:hypothetical protein